MNNIIVALIAGGCSIVGAALSTLGVYLKIATQLEKAQAVTDTNLDNIRKNMESLTEEVRRHNSFGDRITALEVIARQMGERIDRIDGKIARLHDGE